MDGQAEMDEMVERIARNFCKRCGYDPDEPSNNGPRWKTVLNHVRQAIAMRDAIDAEYATHPRPKP